MNSGSNSNRGWSIDQGDYKRIVEAGRSYRNHKRNSRVSKKIYVFMYVLIVILSILFLGHFIAR